MRRILYAAPISFDRKEYESAVLSDELLKRLQLTFGSYISNVPAGSNLANALPQQGGAFGIVSTYDPAKAPLDLAVVADSGSASTVAVQPGWAVFPTGEIIVIDAALTGIQLASTATGAINVVYLQFNEEEVDDIYTRGGVLVPTKVQYLSTPSQYVVSVLLTTWQSMTSVDLQTKIPLAVVGVDSTGTLNIDQSKSQLSNNRPWFTAVDVDHRSRLGTGLVTSSNPHGMSLNDLSVSNGKTILDLLTTRGGIVARDAALTKVPGHLCQEVIPSGQVLHDISGAVTGVQGSWYVALTRYPRQLVRVTIQDANPLVNEIADLAGMLIPGRNYVVFSDLDEQHFLMTVKTLLIEYIAVDVLSPTDQGVITNALTFKPAWSTSPTDETVIAGGLALSSPGLQHSMTDAGPFPSLYRLMLRGDGYIYKTPQPVFCYATLTSMGTAVQPVSITMLGPARLRVGLTLATPNAGLNVQVKLTGLDASNNPISETITFGAAWAQDISIGTSSESAILGSKVYQTTLHTFAKFTAVQIPVAPVNAGSNGAIMVWADLQGTGTNTDPLLDTTYTGTGGASALPLVDFVWDGSKVTTDEAGLKPKLTDLRPISTTIMSDRTTSRGDAMKALFTHYTWWGTYEDFENPKYVANRYVFENAAVHNVANPDEVPRYNTTRMSRLREGLGKFDTYVSRPIAVKPYDTTAAPPTGIRFVPIDRGQYNYRAPLPPGPPGGLEGFSLWARVYLTGIAGPVGAWSSWMNATGSFATNTLFDNSTSYNLDLQNVHYPSGVIVTCSAVNQLVKFQYVVTGPVRGIVTLLDFNNGPTGYPGAPGAWVYDTGIWDDLVGGGR